MLKLSKKAMKQMGYDKTPRERTQAERDEQREAKAADRLKAQAEREQKQQAQEEHRTRIRAEKNAALKSDEMLREAMAEVERVKAARSERAKASATKTLDKTTQDALKLKATVEKLTAQLAKAQAQLDNVAEDHLKAMKDYETFVVVASSSMEDALAKVQECWTVNEEMWSIAPRTFMRDKRDRSTRRAAKALLGLTAAKR